MQYQEIGRSGVSASRVALGVMRLAGKSALIWEPERPF